MDSQEEIALIGKLVEKTIEKKLDWKQTAEDETYIATVQGKLFKVSSLYDSWGNDVGSKLAMVNEAGREIWAVSTRGENDAAVKEAIIRLQKLAQHIADNVDEKISEALKSLDDL